MHSPSKAPYSLRKFKPNDSDYMGVAAVATAVWPDYPTTADELRTADGHRKPELLFGRIVVEREGRIVGSAIYGQPEGSLGVGKFFFNALVHPKYREQGIGKTIYDHILDALSQSKLAVLTTSTRDSQTGAVRFLLSRRFEIVLRRPVLRLHVGSFEKTNVLAGKASDAGQTVEIVTLKDLMATVPDWKSRCWELDWEIVQDLPLPDTPTQPTLERYSRHYEHPTFTPESWFFAVQGDEWVGMSTLYGDPETPGVFYTGLTGVRRSLRRRGIVTAMKLRAIDYVIAQDGKYIETDNEENNPMLDLNLALGFQPGPVLLDFRKTF